MGRFDTGWAILSMIFPQLLVAILNKKEPRPHKTSCALH